MSTTLAAVQSDIAAVEAIAAAGEAAANLVPTLINQAETLFPAKGAGVQKLEFVKGWFTNILTAIGHDLPIVEAMWAKTEPVVGLIVTLATKNGFFASLLAATVHHDAPPADPAPAA